MMLSESSASLSDEPARNHRYLRAPEPVYFPTTEQVPESTSHLERRTALFLSLKRAFAATATIGADQFVYWDPTTARKRLAPDAFVRLGVPHEPIESWKTWERGAPELGVEIVSDSDRPEPVWKGKIERYRAAGFREVVRFNPMDRKHPVRVWDAIDGDLVERAPRDPALLACEALGLWWTVVKDPEIGLMLRLSRDREGRDLLPTPDEETAKAREGEARALAETAKVREANARLEAELAALRAQAAKGGSGGGKRRKGR